ncbi:hypothetical protein HOF56_00355 [Candidatus Peribacteria bacterium]|jgi:hypothetical protein|nr:hypothetical protein [Candidatus Peribacteria bacterium]MBT4021586.1 hypothetical protein [Candidatus Peribacteria bacterium]MBT4240746.1 hypothetical protein [Candidatus Peribacteria bacterium]MBT4474300.1 hypothetical protein [Candidatus Peribacteria bacterium]
MNKQLVDQENSNRVNGNGEVFIEIRKFQNTIANIRNAREYIISTIGEILGASRGVRVSTALEEALVNAVRHGNALVRNGNVVRDDSDRTDLPDENKKIQVVISATQDFVRVEISN